MPKFFDRVKMNLTTTGTGTVTFGSVVSGFQSLSDASVVDADVVKYTIESGTNYEVGTGTIGLTGSTYTMARSPSSSSESDNSAISLTAGAVCFLTMLAEDVVQTTSDLSDVSSTVPTQIKYCPIIPLQIFGLHLPPLVVLLVPQVMLPYQPLLMKKIWFG